MLESVSRSTGVDIADVAGKTFDYVIVGGGTAGLVLAARLSEDPNTSVCVLEAGHWRADDPKVEVPALRGLALNDPDYDWAIKTTPQPEAGNRIWTLPRGRLLGGSSGLNFLVWNAAHAREYDYLGELVGDTALWNWKEVHRCLRKASHFTPATTSEQLRHGALAVGDDVRHGSRGAVQLAFPRWFGPVHMDWNAGFAAMGLSLNPDGVTGSPVGHWCSPSTIDDKTGRRSDSASAYYLPSSTWPNLKVLTAATASRVELETSSDGLQRATGVGFVSQGQTCVVHARREVILSAGSLLSPKLLELSGIGSSSVLQRHGIELKIDLPGIGENLQDHIVLPVAVQLTDLYRGKTWDVLRDETILKAALTQFYDNAPDRGILASSVSGLAFAPASHYLDAEQKAELRRQAESADWSGLSLGIVEGLQKQLDWLDDEEIPNIEYICTPGNLPPAPVEVGKAYHATRFCLQHPFSRGSVHISSRDPSQPPIVDPRYLSNPADVYAMAQAARHAERLHSQPGLKSAIEKYSDPYGKGQSSIQDHEEYVRDFAQTTHHPLGTCSAMPRDKGGVLDPRLKVYGTANLRVVDASAFPLMLSTHIVASVYALAERAAELIIEDEGRTSSGS
ncbi:hypothetical protein V8E36_006671 [Tilletia maclaganii]